MGKKTAYFHIFKWMEKLKNMKNNMLVPFPNFAHANRFELTEWNISSSIKTLHILSILFYILQCINSCIQCNVTNNRGNLNIFRKKRGMWIPLISGDSLSNSQIINLLERVISFQLDLKLGEKKLSMRMVKREIYFFRFINRFTDILNEVGL